RQIELATLIQTQRKSLTDLFGHSWAHRTPMDTLEKDLRPRRFLCLLIVDFQTQDDGVVGVLTELDQRGRWHSPDGLLTRLWIWWAMRDPCSMDGSTSAHVGVVALGQQLSPWHKFFIGSRKVTLGLKEGHRRLTQ